MSDATEDRVQLWTFGADIANETFSTVNAIKMNTTRQIRLDPYGNLYVADSARQRVVMFCGNATISLMVIGSGVTSTPTLDTPSGIAFDSQFNLDTHDCIEKNTYSI